MTDFLLENWNLKVRNDFIKKLTSKIKQVSEQPESCPQSTDFSARYFQKTFYNSTIKKYVVLLHGYFTRKKSL